SVKTIELLCRVMGDAIIEGREVAKTRAAEIGSQQDQSKESEQSDDKPRRRMRERSRRTDGRDSGSSEG
ncbi:MAG: hypothetical protein RL156_1859, partial [Bacteroidota bacterium]